MRKVNTGNPALKLLNKEITSDILKHMQNLWKDHLNAHCDHRHKHAHSLEDHRQSSQQSTSTHTIHFHIFNYKISTTPKHIANCLAKQFTNIVKHATHKTYRSINRETHKIQGYIIALTTTQVQDEIKQSKNNNAQCPDKLNIRHLKHIVPLGLTFLTSMLKTEGGVSWRTG